MGLTQRRRVLGAKLEAVAGTPETITNAEAMYVENLKFNPDVATLTHETNVSSGSQVLPSKGRSMASMSFDVKMYGGNAAGTAPFWGALLQACAFSETIVVSTSVTYQPVSSSLKTITLKAFMDGISYRIHGARGTVSCIYNAGEVPTFSFNFQGIFEPATDVDAYKDEANLVGSAFPSFQPKAFKAALFKVATTYKAILNSYRWDIGNQLLMIPDANVTDYKRVDIIWPRQISGEIDAEAVLKATYDFFNDLANKTAFQLEGFTGSDESGNGTGTLNTMTDSSKNWPADLWNGKSLRDSAGTVFAITDSDATTLTVAGTPASGDYIIYDAGKLIRTTQPKCVSEAINDNDFNGLYHFGIPYKFYQNSADDELVIQLT